MSTAPFDCYDVILDEIDKADRERKRIIAFRFSREAWGALVDDPNTRHRIEMSSSGASLLGIPLEQDGCDDGPAKIEARYEMRGPYVLIHDYEGDILHGRRPT